jgi:hypothetical protein
MFYFLQFAGKWNLICHVGSEESRDTAVVLRTSAEQVLKEFTENLGESNFMREELHNLLFFTIISVTRTKYFDWICSIPGRNFSRRPHSQISYWKMSILGISWFSSVPSYRFRDNTLN